MKYKYYVVSINKANEIEWKLGVHSLQQAWHQVYACGATKEQSVKMLDTIYIYPTEERAIGIKDILENGY